MSAHAEVLERMLEYQDITKWYADNAQFRLLNEFELDVFDALLALAED